MKISENNWIFAISSLAALPLLQGCLPAAYVAASPVMAATYYAGAGMVAFQSFKIVQMSTGEGEAKISFTDDDESIKNDDSLAQISRPAVFPTNGYIGMSPVDVNLVHLTEEMQNSGKFEQVITPVMVSKAIKRLALNSNPEIMTEREKLTALKMICSETHADSVIIFSEAGRKGEANFFSFSRMESSSFTRMLIYSLKENEFIYDGILKVNIEHGSIYKAEISDELGKLAAESAAEKFILMTL